MKNFILKGITKGVDSPLPVLLSMALFLLFSAGLEAQSFRESPYNKRIFSGNAGAVFSGDGDCIGIGTSLSHLKTIGKRFYVRQSINSWIVNGESWIEGAYENQTAIDVSAELGFSPFKADQRFFSMHGGLCGAFLINTSSSYGGTWSSYNYRTGEYSYMRYFEQGFEKSLDAGFTFGLSYHRQFSPALYLNARADFRSHSSSGTAISMLTLGIGFDAREVFKQ